MSLEFATTEELITELSQRTTFVGLVIHSTTEHRNPDTVHSSFRISTSLSHENLSKLLGMATQSIESRQ